VPALGPSRGDLRCRRTSRGRPWDCPNRPLGSDP
jgi:hypothetical protein